MVVYTEPSLADKIDSCQYGLVVTISADRPISSPVADCAGAAPGADLSAAEAEQLAVALKALADPVRLRLFARLATRDEVCVCDFPDVGVSQPTVSHHLRKLREAGLVVAERRGTWVYYRAVEGALAPLGSFIGTVAPD